MNDTFLKNYRIKPRAAFVDDLRSRLGVDEGTHRPFLRPAGLGAGALLLVLALALAVSPAVRAQVEDWAGQVGGILFTATGDYPGGDEPVTIVPGDNMSLEEARAVLPFTVDLPAWVPEGYRLEETVTVQHFESGLENVLIFWNAPGKASLTFVVENRPSGESKVIVGPGSIEEVLVHGEPAALVRGGWNADSKQWEERGNLQLYFGYGPLTYTLLAVESDIPVDELIRMAESLPVAY